MSRDKSSWESGFLSIFMRKLAKLGSTALEVLGLGPRSDKSLGGGVLISNHALPERNIFI